MNTLSFKDDVTPEWLARLQYTIFEGLSAEDARWFSAEWVRSMPVGKNLEPVKWKFCAYLMKRNIERVLLLDISEGLKKKIVDAIRQVLAVHEGAVDSGVWNESAWSAARSAARSAWAAAAAESAAAWSAARSAEAWSASAARSASASSAAAEAAAAAWSAARSAARAAAAEAEYKQYALELLDLLKNA